jgi:hypothetical protein
MNRRERLAAGFCAAVLGLQAFTAFRATHGDEVRYWPFLNYPMYAPSHQRGEQIVEVKLLVTPCDSPLVKTPRTFADLHLPQYRFRETLVRAASAPPAAAGKRAELLRKQLEQYEPRRLCRLELPGSSWQVGRAWILSDSTASPVGPLDTWR